MAHTIPVEKKKRYSVAVRVEFIVEVDAIDEDDACAQAEEIIDHDLMHGEGGSNGAFEIQEDTNADLMGDSDV